MEEAIRNALKHQYVCLAQNLRDSIEACPDDSWSAERGSPPFHQIAYHTIFFLDWYSGDSPELFKAWERQAFAAEGDQTLDNVPSKVFTKGELLDYLDASERKCLGIIENLSEEDFARLCAFEWKVGQSVLDMLLQGLRHLEHHIGQLNYILRLETGSTPGWIDFV